MQSSDGSECDNGDSSDENDEFDHDPDSIDATQVPFDIQDELNDLDTEKDDALPRLEVI
jgi:hypothetical protein